VLVPSSGSTLPSLIPHATPKRDHAVATVQTNHADMHAGHFIQGHWLVADGVVVGYSEPVEYAISKFAVPQDLKRPFVLRAVSRCNSHGSWSSEVIVETSIAEQVALDVFKLLTGLSTDDDGRILKGGDDDDEL